MGASTVTNTLTPEQIFALSRVAPSQSKEVKAARDELQPGQIKGDFLAHIEYDSTVGTDFEVRDDTSWKDLALLALSKIQATNPAVVDQIFKRSQLALAEGDEPLPEAEIKAVEKRVKELAVELLPKKTQKGHVTGFFRAEAVELVQAAPVLVAAKPAPKALSSVAAK